MRADNLTVQYNKMTIMVMAGHHHNTLINMQMIFWLAFACEKQEFCCLKPVRVRAKISVLAQLGVEPKIILYW